VNQLRGIPINTVLANCDRTLDFVYEVLIINRNLKRTIVFQSIKNTFYTINTFTSWICTDIRSLVQ